MNKSKISFLLAFTLFNICCISASTVNYSPDGGALANLSPGIDSLRADSPAMKLNNKAFSIISKAAPTAAELDTAKQLLNKALDRQPDCKLCLANMFSVYKIKGDKQEMMQWVELQINKDIYKGYFLMLKGLIYWNDGKEKQAMVVLKTSNNALDKEFEETADIDYLIEKAKNVYRLQGKEASIRYLKSIRSKTRKPIGENKVDEAIKIFDEFPKDGFFKL